MKFPDADFRDKCFKGQELGLDASSDGGTWAEHRSEITSAWEDLVKKLLEETPDKEGALLNDPRFKAIFSS